MPGIDLAFKMADDDRRSRKMRERVAAVAEPPIEISEEEWEILLKED